MLTTSLSHVLHYASGMKPAIVQKLNLQWQLIDLLNMTPQELRQVGLAESAITYLKTQAWPEVAQDLNWAAETGGHVITIETATYPPLLREINTPPTLLYALGNIDLLMSPQIAIVGTRKPTPNGHTTAKQFSMALARAGFTITSGLALGIDGACHDAAITAQGKTLAVLGNGLHHVYPRCHAKLYEQIRQHGLLISEFPPHVAPQAKNFPQRNRIISGLSVATFVIEAALQSGSLITARLAAEQGREVFAMPGSIHNPQARGCHALIKNGAKLVETVTDILEELQPLLQSQLDLTLPHVKKHKLPQRTLDKNQADVLQYINFEPTPLERVIELSGSQHAAVLTALVQLELAGYVLATAAGYTRIA